MSPALAVAAAPAAEAEDRASVPALRAAPRRWTALAFVCAPAVPTALAALVAAGLAFPRGGAGNAVGVFFGSAACLAFGGYLSALLIAVPVYCLALRRRAIPPALSILFGGFTAAMPWAAFGVVSGQDELMLVASATFGLGCIGGLTFTLVRDGWRRGGARAAEKEPP